MLLAYLRHAALGGNDVVELVRCFSLAKPRFTTGYLPCFAFGCLTSSISAALRFRFATALREPML